LPLLELSPTSTHEIENIVGDNTNDGFEIRYYKCRIVI